LNFQPVFPKAQSSYLANLNYLPDVDPEFVFSEHRCWGTFQAQTGETQRPSSPLPRSDGALRVGCVSPDLRRHPVAYFLEPILIHHDPREV
jgi:predicted O-linked N-acetylglucosamine transferase (SPINDLY family)